MTFMFIAKTNAHAIDWHQMKWTYWACLFMYGWVDFCYVTMCRPDVVVRVHKNAILFRTVRT